MFYLYLVGKLDETKICHLRTFGIQSTLVISKSKGPSETLRDIRTLTYQVCRIEGKKTIGLPNFTNEHVI